jgi:hypothetical protein
MGRGGAWSCPAHPGDIADLTLARWFRNDDPADPDGRRCAPIFGSAHGVVAAGVTLSQGSGGAEADCRPRSWRKAAP